MMLIPNCWYAIVESSELHGGKPFAVRRLNRSLVCWRDGDGQVSVIDDRCPHRGSRLSLGRVLRGRLQCPFHGFEFNAAGNCEFIPANGRGAPVPKSFQCGLYPSREAHGFVWVWHGTPRAEYPPLPWFADLEGFECASTRNAWDADLTRAVEGLLDVSHLPFVHARTIGRGQKTLVNGPYATLMDETIRIWPSNQPDEGLPASKPSQIPSPVGEAMLEFRFPNVWQIRLSPRFRVVNVIAPVESGRCVVYVRSYLKMRLPRWLVRLAARGNNVFNRYVLAEDYKVIRSQTPKVSGQDIGEQFIPADRPIAMYLRHRRDLIDAAAGNGD